MWLDKNCIENAADLTESKTGRKFVMSLLVDLLNEQTIMSPGKWNETSALERSNIAKAIRAACIGSPRGLKNLRLAEDERYDDENNAALDKVKKTS